MGMASVEHDLASVEPYRGRLFGIAYRMLGQVQEAEDLVQETYLRWHQADRTTIETPLAWLATVITRLAIDRLRLASERTRYVGPWLPEPLAHRSDHADYPLQRRDDLSMAFLVTLERLAPEERAAFLLRDVFDEDYAAIGAILDKREPAVRQIVHRARRRVRDERLRFRVDGAAARRLISRFLDAVVRQDKEGLLAVLAEQVTFTADGGGKVPAVRNVVRGAERTAHLLLGVQAKWGHLVEYVLSDVNGEPGVRSFIDGRLHAVTAFAIDGHHIVHVYRVMNPDKLGMRRSGPR